jgi:hypothetical protein
MDLSFERITRDLVTSIKTLGWGRGHSYVFWKEISTESLQLTRDNITIHIDVPNLAHDDSSFVTGMDIIYASFLLTLVSSG